MLGFVDSAPNVFVCAPIFTDNASKVNKLVNFLDVFLMKLDRVLLSVVYPHDLGLFGVDLETSFRSFF